MTARPAALHEEAKAAASAPRAVRRRFLDVAGRRVHYFRAGEGPPVVLVHSSPANARFLAPEIAHLSRDHTVFAFDTPGFGLSDPLPLDEMTLADLADALAQTLAALAMPPCPVYGTHTGAAIALALGARHPERVTGLVLDGVPAFTAQECAALFGDYFRKFKVSDLGGHYADVWTRFRDQYAWFPWTARHPDRLNPYDLGTPEAIHAWVSMYFDAADHYTPAYRAALYSGDAALAAAQALCVPAIYTASDTDMLAPHLQRLPPMKSGQEIRRFGTAPAAKHALIAEGLTRFAGSDAAPRDRDAVESSVGIARQFLDRADGGQLHLRSAGRRDAPPLLLLHDAPGSAALLEPLILALAERRFVLAPDLPGCGESDPLWGEPPSIAAYAAIMDELLRALGTAQAEVHGAGFGGSVAVELARAAPDRVVRLTLEGLLAPEPAERDAMRLSYAPSIPITAEGAHWYRTWLMLRDSRVWFPWYDRTHLAQRARPGDFDAERLHRWTLEVMRARESYGDLIHAALDHDAPAALNGVRCPVVRVVDAATPLSAYDAKLRELTRSAREVGAEEDPQRFAKMLFDFGGPAT